MPLAVALGKSNSRTDEAVNRRLVNLTGSADVQLTDREYMYQLYDRLEEEHLKGLSLQEKRLREEEAKRIRKLKREGIIDEAQYLKEMGAALHSHAGHTHHGNECDSQIDGEKGESLHIPLVSVLYGDNPEALSYRGYLKNENGGHSHQHHSHHYQHPHHRQHRDKIPQKKDPQIVTEHGDSGLAAHQDATVGDKSGVSQEGIHSPRYIRPQSATVDELEREDTIARMYELAQSMVIIEVGLQANKGKMKK